MFFTLYDDGIQLSAALRDKMHPHKYCFVDIEDNLIIFTPTDDPTGYIIHGQGRRQKRITWCAAKRAIRIPESKRIYGESADNGTIVFEIKEESNNGKQ